MQASVSNLDLYRIWKASEELDVGWLLTRLYRQVEQTEAMKVGCAFHSALELASCGCINALTSTGYRFEVQCDGEIYLPQFRELSLSQQYGPLTVKGRVDAIEGKTVIDHKTTAQFDPDRFMESYQWRFYLDMFDCDTFRWNVFVLAETDDPKTYIVRDLHILEQKRYPNLHSDCERLAAEYVGFAEAYLKEAQ